MQTMKIKLIDKKISENNEIAYLTFKVSENFDFKAWQFVMLDNWNLKRAYSIASSPSLLKEWKICFYVKKASENGMSAYLVDKIKIQDELDMMWPFWHMFIKEQSEEKIYLLISAWSWLWPILWIYEDLIQSWKYKNIYNFYQERYFENIVKDVFEKMVSFEKENVKNFFFLSKWKHLKFQTWYVEEKLKEVLSKMEDKENIEAYICWKPTFVDEIESLLKNNWVERVYFEKY